MVIRIAPLILEGWLVSATLIPCGPTKPSCPWSPAFPGGPGKPKAPVLPGNPWGPWNLKRSLCKDKLYFSVFFTLSTGHVMCLGEDIGPSRGSIYSWGSWRSWCSRSSWYPTRRLEGGKFERVETLYNYDLWDLEFWPVHNTYQNSVPCDVFFTFKPCWSISSIKTFWSWQTH